LTSFILRFVIPVSNPYRYAINHNQYYQLCCKLLLVSNPYRYAINM